MFFKLSIKMQFDAGFRW